MLFFICCIRNRQENIGTCEHVSMYQSAACVCVCGVCTVCMCECTVCMCRLCVYVVFVIFTLIVTFSLKKKLLCL